MKKVIGATLLVLMAGVGFADIHVVDLAGGGDFTSIHTAVDDASSGDTILVSSGTYIITPSQGVITVDKELCIQGSGYDLPEEGGTLLQTSTNTLFDFTAAADGSKLQGFRIYGSHGATMISVAADDMVIENNHITTVSRTVWVIQFSSTTGDTLRNNYIGSVNTSTYRYAVSVSYSIDFVLSNNVIYGFGYNIYGVDFAYGTNVLATNNLFLNNMNAININSSEHTVVNNIFMNGSGTQLSVNGGVAANVSYNCFYNNGTDGNTGINPILDNPDFVDYTVTDVFGYASYDDSQFDLHLQGVSPCVNGGNPEVIYNDPDATVNDVGLYGWHWPMGTNGAPAMPVINNISVTPSSVDPDGTISIEVIGRFGN